jgi:TonB family protein
VLLPVAVRTMSPGVQRAVLAHELWHVRRHDPLWTLAEEVLRAALWFHPAIWYLVSQVQSAREEVVDELAVLTTNSRRSYLEALLAFADEPAVYPAAPFIRRRQLFRRMLLVSKEAVMSSRRIVASAVAMAGVLVLTGWYGAQAFPLTLADAMQPAAVDDSQAQAQPRDPRPGAPRPATSRELELKAATAADPSNVPNWLELATAQEARGANDEAEATFKAALSATSGNAAVAASMAKFFNRTGQFDKLVAVLEDAAAQNPTDPAGHLLLAVHYWEKAQKDQTLTAADKLMYLDSGIAASDRALVQRSDYAEALVYKNILLRMKANLETNPARQQQLITEANTLRNRAMELQKLRAAAGVTAGSSASSALSPPPPPPPPPPMQASIEGQEAVRIGGEIKTPTKIRDVRPVYPPEAMATGVSGMVIVEALIDQEGAVRSARVLRSIPQLDHAALDAVRQWRFTPTVLNGVAVPVIMTLTVNFKLQ